MRNSIITSLIMAMSIYSFGQTSSKNYVKTVTARQATTTSVISSTSKSMTKQSVQYVDGLGRPLQSIVRWGSATGDDIVTPNEYDQFGRPVKSYLPYQQSQTNTTFRGNAVAEQNSYYDIKFGGTSGDHAFSEVEYESSPLNRVLRQASPGYDWRLNGGANITFTYEINKSSDNVKLYRYDDLETSSSGLYPANELFKNTTTDEDGNQTIEFTDRQGRTILKKSYSGNEWAETYYIYDDQNRLRIVLPPEANKDIQTKLGEVSGYQTITSSQNVTNNGNYVYHTNATITIPSTTTLTDAIITPLEVLSPEFLAKWAFQYEYDGRNRMTQKQVPGAEPVYMIYDQWDRLVLTQDGNQRLSNEWLFTKYDALNRPIITGKKVISGSLQSIRDAVAASSTRFETLASGPLEGYSNNAYPSTTATELLTVSYYDDYDFVSTSDLSGTTFQSVYTTAPDGFHIVPVENTAVKGLVTGTLTRGEGTDFITTITYYDGKYGPIQVVSENHMGGTDIISNQYDFVGNVRKTQTAHTFDGNTTTIKRRYTYDHMDRLLNTYHQIDTDDEQLISQNTYSELGELITKELHEGEQEVNYTYNIRGWLTSINDSQLTDPQDLFGMELYYNNNAIVSSNDRFNGNISAMQWSDASGVGTNNHRSYNYTYDGLNRLTNADHRTNGTNNNSFDVNNLQYDLNGNILSLDRRAEATNSYMDELAYSYTGNQLQKVDDSGDDTAGFTESGSGTDYTYDDNGNMISDANKDITSIEYNHLNLPIKVTFDAQNYIEYLYDAAGIKLRQTVYEAGSVAKTTDYVGEFIYENDTLQLIQHEEGRIIYKDYEGVWDYQYHLKDHLGNVRVTFSTMPENYTMVATMEDSNETENFNNYLADSDGVASNSGTHVSRNSNTANDGLDLNTFLSINKGDTVKMSAHAYYNDANSSYTLASTIGSALFTVFDPDNVAEGISVTQTSFDDAFLSGTTLGGRSTSSSAPAAFINYIFFDKDMNYEHAGFKQITTASNGASIQVIVDDFIADQDGYIMVYLSNETQGSELIISWDDFTVVHGKTNVMSTQDYYPFGLTFNESVRVASTNQNWKYNSYEYIPELQWIDYGARMYDPAIGRWNAVDPLAETYDSNTPYSYVRNNPTNLFDIGGMADNETLDEWVTQVESEWAAIDAGASISDVWGSGSLLSSGSNMDSKKPSDNESTQRDPIESILEENGIGSTRDQMLLPSFTEELFSNSKVVLEFIFSPGGKGKAGAYVKTAMRVDKVASILEIVDGVDQYLDKKILNKYASSSLNKLENYSNVLVGIENKYTDNLNGLQDKLNNLPNISSRGIDNIKTSTITEMTNLRRKLGVVAKEYVTINALIYAKKVDAQQIK